MIKVEKAGREDIPALCALETECFQTPWGSKSFEDFFDLDFTIALKAVVGQSVAGYAGLYISGSDGYITNVAVTAAMRRKGVGRTLIKELKNLPEVENLFLEVRESNLPAITLYESEGFLRDGVRKNFYSNPRENAILMSHKRKNNADIII